MNTANTSINALNPDSVGSQLSFHFLDNTQAKVITTPIDIYAMASRAIEKNCLHCFYAEYLTLGGKNLPKDIVNMVIQQIVLPQKVLRKKSIKKTIILHISKQISSLRIRRQKDIWRLSNIITEHEYGFSVSYNKWLFHRLL